MRKFNKILSFNIVIILIIGVMFFIYTIWITPVSKASKIRTSINYTEVNLKEESVKKNDVLYIKIEPEPKPGPEPILEQKKLPTKNVSDATIINEKQTTNATIVTVEKFNYPSGWLENFNNQIAQLKKEYPAGYYWNSANNAENGGVTKIPCNHNEELYYCNTYQGKSTQAYNIEIGAQCAGFASMLSDRIFEKDAPTKVFYNYDNIRIGDQARINGNSHTVFIIDKTDDYVIVAECNADYNTCIISWGRKIPRNELTGFYITRWQ